MIDSILQYDKQLLLSLNGSHSLFADGLMLTLTDAKTWIPMYVALLYLVIKNNNSMTKILAIIAGAALCVLFTGTLDDLFVKPVVARWRPTHDPEIGYMVDVVDGYRGGRYGFFSAHAANTFSIALFFVLLVRSRWLSVALVLWSLINCWTRIYLGMHYPSDIAAGLLWGMISGALVYTGYRRAYTRLSPKLHFISSQYTKTGYGLADITLTINVMTASVIYAILRALTMTY